MKRDCASNHGTLRTAHPTKLNPTEPRRPARASHVVVGVACLLVGLVPARGQTFVFDTPSDDRWQYPFNASGGARATASCFSSLGTGIPSFDNFNDRDGIVLVAWDTTAQIPPGRGPAAYDIQSIVVTLRNEPGATWLIDLTVDEWYTYDVNNDTFVNGDGYPRGDPQDTDGESDDEDPGRPIELFGVGFGPTYTAQSWNENSPYIGGGPTLAAPRDPFPFVFQAGTFDLLHCEENVQGRFNDHLAQPVTNFTPTPWAIGVPVGYTPTQQATPFDVVFAIDLSLSDGAVRAYFQEQLDEGRLFVSVTSLHPTVQGGTPGSVPSFYQKEGLGLHPDAAAPKLTIVLRERRTGDTDGNGCVNLSDLTRLLSNFGNASGMTVEDGDCDGDGDVDLSDLALLLAHFGTGTCG